MHDVLDDIPDHDIIMEAIREKCVYELVMEHREDKVLKRFFNYLYLMHGLTTKKGRISDKEAEKALGYTGLTLETVQKCVNESFIEEGNYQSDNKYLREDRMWQYIMQVHEHPAITINNHTYHGDFNGKDISHALCASFRERPDICK